MNNSYLEHHGIKGMKWGVRKSIRSEQKHRMPLGAKVDGFQSSKKPFGAKIDGPKDRPRAEGYTDEQYMRDVSFYGKRGANRINKRMLKGEGYMGARHHEVNRKKAKIFVRSAIAAVSAEVASLYVREHPELINTGITKTKQLLNNVVKFKR